MEAEDGHRVAERPEASQIVDLVGVAGVGVAREAAEAGGAVTDEATRRRRQLRAWSELRAATSSRWTSRTASKAR